MMKVVSRVPEVELAPQVILKRAANVVVQVGNGSDNAPF
jgi:hypothetical protein